MPPGRARLCAQPSLTGSLPLMATIGITAVARRAAASGAGPPATMTATSSATSSAVKAASRSGRPSAWRASIRRFWPATQPCSLSARAKPSIGSGLAPDGALPNESKPIRVTPSRGCARSEAALPVRAAPSANNRSRRCFIRFACRPCPPGLERSLDHLVRALQHCKTSSLNGRSGIATSGHGLRKFIPSSLALRSLVQRSIRL